MKLMNSSAQVMAPAHKQSFKASFDSDDKTLGVLDKLIDNGFGPEVLASQLVLKKSESDDVISLKMTGDTSLQIKNKNNGVSLVVDTDFHSLSWGVKALRIFTGKNNEGYKKLIGKEMREYVYNDAFADFKKICLDSKVFDIDLNIRLINKEKEDLKKKMEQLDIKEKDLSQGKKEEYKRLIYTQI